MYMCLSTSIRFGIELDSRRDMGRDKPHENKYKSNPMEGSISCPFVIHSYLRLEMCRVVWRIAPCRRAYTYVSLFYFICIYVYVYGVGRKSGMADALVKP